MGAVVLYLVLHNLAGEPQLSFGENARPAQKKRPFFRAYERNILERKSTDMDEKGIQ